LRIIRVLVVAVSLLGARAWQDCPRGGEGLEPWASNRGPADVPGVHVEEITRTRHRFTVIQQGTMDGQNCRTPHGSWDPMEQTWESNRSVRMENLGETDVVNPWLSNGRDGFRNIKEIVAGALRPGMTDREKALALYYLEMTHRFHATTGDSESNDPVKVFNVYGYTTCGDDSVALAGLWREAGLETRPARVAGHVVTQVFHDGGWHLFDADKQCLYLLRDNHTVAGAQEVARDHDLIKRTHAEGLLRPDTRAGSEWEAALYICKGDPGGTRDAPGRHTMDMTLRPGESITWRWGHLNPVKYHGREDLAASFGRPCAETICNGLWQYRPDFTGERWRSGAAVENVRSTQEGLKAEPGKTAVVVWKMQNPYVFVGGKLDWEGDGARFSASVDEGKSWKRVGTSLDELFPREGQAHYRYLLRCELADETRLKSLTITNDVQMAPLALPGMAVGENHFLYTDESAGPRRFRITQEWVERSASAPPAAPAGAIYPRDGGETDGTDIVFQWSPSVDPDGERIGDYSLELSEYPDMRWPLSPNFRKLISRTADRGTARYTLPYEGLLTPDRPYFWRVRAKDEKGVWGPWSRTWRFTPRGPLPPVDLVLEFDARLGRGNLRWKRCPGGRAPAKYRVYGSDEEGFTASDTDYDVMDYFAGDWRRARLNRRSSSNFVAETDGTELTVLGEGLRIPSANKAFYRVVAVDARGRRSWSSDFAEAPRPLIYTAPVAAARVGQPWRYQAATIKSLGDLGYRTVTREQVPEFWPVEERLEILNGPPWNLQVVKFWDVQQPRYFLLEGPAWLRIDEATGLVSGLPDSAGRFRVAVAAELLRNVEQLDLDALQWGSRRVTGVTLEKMGPAVQRFVLEVAP
jgi:hypothetical protein